MTQKNKFKSLFFLGKGGVGKSTSASLTAVHLARSNKRVLLVSMDPAHNQSDIFDTKLSEKSHNLTENLIAKELNISKWIKIYLSEVETQIKQTYSYLTALNLDKYLDIIRFSPGIEEYALLLAYKKITNEFVDRDYIVFDMPPTALTLKFFGLPKLSLLWLEKLMELRNKIIEKKEIITKVKVGKKEIQRDKIISKLEKQISDYKTVSKDFENSEKTILNLVMNTDKLSFSESKLIVERLKTFQLSVSNIIINKVPEKFSFNNIKKEFGKKNYQIFPLSETPLIGLKVLQNYLDSKITANENKFTYN